MFLRKEKRKGRTYLSIVQTYRDQKTKKTKTKYIKTLGYLDELEKEYDDPISHFKAEAKKLTDEYNKKVKPINIQIDPTKKLSSGTNQTKNFGYVALSHFYHELELDQLINNRQRKLNIDYNLNSVMKLLVFGRAIFPGSKKSTYEKKDMFFDKTDFTQDDVYTGLSYLNRLSDDIQQWLFEVVSQKYGRDTSTTYYDVTNYYFEINQNDEDILDDNGNVIETGFRKRGAEKNHRPDPIIQMGLLMDNNGLPISYELFDGNTHDTLTLRPTLKNARMKYGLGKVVVVADKGINSADNIYYLLSGNNGYVLSKSVRGGSKELKAYALDPSGYEKYGEDSLIKSEPNTRTIMVSSADDNKNKFSYKVKEQQVIIYSEKYAKRAKAERENTLKKAKDLISNPSRYNRATSYGAAKYIDNIAYDEDGVVAESKMSLNEKLAEEEAKLDGYYCIVTSEEDLSAREVADIYHGLWKIEESFKITKTHLDARPTYVFSKEHINAHFLTCFVTLLISRLLELKTDEKYHIGKLLESLKRSNYTLIEQNHYVLNYYDDVLKDIGNAIGIEFDRNYATLKEIKSIIGESKKR